MSKIVFEKDFSQHPLHYFILLCFQLVGLWGIFWFSYSPKTQFILILFMAAAYIIWGILHHSKHGDLHLKIILEYSLFALLAVFLFSSLLLHP